MCSETAMMVRIDPRSAEAMRGHPVYAIMLLAGLPKTSEEDRTSSSIESCLEQKHGNIEARIEKKQGREQPS